MIRMGLAENGADSLKAAYLIMEKLSTLEEGLAHNLKDAVISLNHGIEILFKLILKNYEEYLIFADIDKYMIAKKAMLEKGKDNVLEVNPLLKTVTLNEAIRRVKYLCNYDISSDFEVAISYLNKIRNQFMHYEINLSDGEMLELLVKMRIAYDLSYDFFITYIEDLYSILEDARYEITIDDYSDEIAEMHRSMMEDSTYEEYRENKFDY
ncbi:hypothetical protein [Paenibacillus terrigena]|uniref:hypothetical protein n=1 Tax=Paenibacillus terrigena TaxID=369333 RepID=UPI00037C2718|nr:hypothetical protein [Paenibacillus terrigena]